MFTGGVVIFTLASVVCAAAPSLGVLVAARAVQAVGAAALVPASLALVVEAFPSERRAHAVAMWGATAALAAGLGPPIGGALVEADSWRLAFLINLPLGVVAVAAASRVLVESRAPGRRAFPDLGGSILLGAGLALLTLGIVQGPEWGWSDPVVVGSFVGAAVAFALFVRSSLRHAMSGTRSALLRSRRSRSRTPSPSSPRWASTRTC